MSVLKHLVAKETDMTNLGTIDRIMRAVVGVFLISLVFAGPQTLWGWLGVVPLLTAVAGFCPAYRLFGLCTKRNKA
jgi:Na+/proline symporter